jgi:hypothetical protein
MYSSTLSLTLALVRCVWSTPRPGRFTSGKGPVPILQEAVRNKNIMCCTIRTVPMSFVTTPNASGFFFFPALHFTSLRVYTLCLDSLDSEQLLKYLLF